MTPSMSLSVHRISISRRGIPSSSTLSESLTQLSYCGRCSAWYWNGYRLFRLRTKKPGGLRPDENNRLRPKPSPNQIVATGSRARLRICAHTDDLLRSEEHTSELQ